jgi:hypothetical protein
MDNFLQKLKQDDVKNYVFKIEVKGLYFETQDCKPFINSVEYKEIDYLDMFVKWLEVQPYRAAKEGLWQEVTEIWKKTDEKNMTLVWLNKLGWLEDEMQ